MRTPKRSRGQESSQDQKDAKECVKSCAAYNENVGVVNQKRGIDVLRRIHATTAERWAPIGEFSKYRGEEVGEEVGNFPTATAAAAAAAVTATTAAAAAVTATTAAAVAATTATAPKEPSTRGGGAAPRREDEGGRGGQVPGRVGGRRARSAGDQRPAPPPSGGEHPPIREVIRR